MRLDVVSATASILLGASAMTDPLPADWSPKADGTLNHGPSGAVCPVKLADFARTTIESKGAPDLGICTYAGGNNSEGLIRVRQYVRGQGETPLAIQNDEALIEPKPDTPNVVIGFRVGPGPEKNGAPTRQAVLTTANNGLLIDCIGRQLASDSSEAGFEFAQQCIGLQPQKK
ncbi:MAG: hypothetical protein ACKVRO_06115 [Micropepsaceae bacterium]